MRGPDLRSEQVAEHRLAVGQVNRLAQRIPNVLAPGPVRNRALRPLVMEDRTQPHRRLQEPKPGPHVGPHDARLP